MIQKLLLCCFFIGFLVAGAHAAGITGPKHGINGSRYTVADAGSTGVTWSTSDSRIATIDASGVLTVASKGIVNIQAKANGATLSKEIMVGTPRYALGKLVRNTNDPGYRITAVCIDEVYSNFLNANKDVITFQWGLKTRKQPLKWAKSDSRTFVLNTLDDNTTVYLKTVDTYGNESAPQYRRGTYQDKYDFAYPVSVFNSKGDFYDNSGNKPIYDYAIMGLEVRDNVSTEYYNAKYSPTAATVISDQNKLKSFNWVRQGYMKDIIPSAEIKHIISLPDRSVVMYKLILLNFNRDVIQEFPFAVMYRADYPN